jgi:CRISPR-associated protein Cas2
MPKESPKKFRLCLGGVRAMWVIAMFDLPVVTKKQKTQYRRFHDALEELGFSMMQFSIYGRPCASVENADFHIKRVKAKLPPEGEVRLIKLTALQFSRMEIFQGKKSGQPEEPPGQISLF